jgi:hypothetical protein
MSEEVRRGHAAHTRDSQERGLEGEFPRPVRITMLGAGSSFTPRLVNDVLRTPGAARGEIALCDIDAERLGTMRELIEKLVRSVRGACSRDCAPSRYGSTFCATPSGSVPTRWCSTTRTP